MAQRLVGTAAHSHGSRDAIHDLIVPLVEDRKSPVACGDICEREGPVFIALREGVEAPSVDALIQWCKAQMAHFKCPRYIVFGELPRTATGKVQKFVLRDWAKKVSDKVESSG